jgi:predicted ester cyclase
MGNLRAVVERHYSDLRNKDYEGMRSMFDKDVVTVMPGAGTMNGIEPFLEYARTFFRALPDGHPEAADIIEEGEIVIATGRLVGTHSGPLATPGGDEIRASGRRVSLPYADMFHVDSSGKVDRHQVYFDQLTLMEQLGVAPEGAPTAA